MSDDDQPPFSQGEFINACFGGRFMYSLMNEEVDLEAGNYVFMVDPIWDESANLSEDFKEVLVDVYGHLSLFP